jgi:hypothetical protein
MLYYIIENSKMEIPEEVANPLIRLYKQAYIKKNGEISYYTLKHYRKGTKTGRPRQRKSELLRLIAKLNPVQMEEIIMSINNMINQPTFIPNGETEESQRSTTTGPDTEGDCAEETFTGIN